MGTGQCAAGYRRIVININCSLIIKCSIEIDDTVTPVAAVRKLNRAAVAVNKRLPTGEMNVVVRPAEA